MLILYGIIRNALFTKNLTMNDIQNKFQPILWCWRKSLECRLWFSACYNGTSSLLAHWMSASWEISQMGNSNPSNNVKSVITQKKVLHRVECNKKAPSYITEIKIVFHVNLCVITGTPNIVYKFASSIIVFIIFNSKLSQEEEFFFLCSLLLFRSKTIHIVLL